MLYFFCLVSTVPPGIVPHWRCYADGDEHKTLEMGGEEAHGGVCGLCRSRKLQTQGRRGAELCGFWHASLRSSAEDGFSTERKSTLMKFTADTMLGGISHA